MSTEKKWSIVEIFNTEGALIIKKSYEKEAELKDVIKIMKFTHNEQSKYKIRSYKIDGTPISIISGELKIFKNKK